MTRTSPRWFSRLIRAGLLLLVLVAGCSGDDSPEDASTTTAGPDVAPTSSSEPPPTTGSVPGGSTDTTLPEWTPIDASTGRWLAFTSSRTGTEEIFVVDLDSGVQHQLTELGDVSSPAWSPDRSQIAFQCPREGESNGEGGLGFSDICLVRLVDGFVRPLTNDDAFDLPPVWSPDGTRVAFNTVIEGRGSVVRVTDLAGGAEPVELAEGDFAAWSPDGMSLAFALDGAIAVADLATDSQRKLTDLENGLESGPVWSPDGEQLGFSCVRDSTATDTAFPPTDICVVGVDTGELRRVTDDESRRDTGPVWSPDGERVAFTSSSAEANPFFDPTDVWVVSVDGSGAPEVATSGAAFGSALAWAPDGSVLAVISFDGGIVLVEPDTGTEELVVVDPTASEPRWAPGS